MKYLQRLWPVLLFCGASAIADTQPLLEIANPDYGQVTSSYGGPAGPPEHHPTYRPGSGPGYGKHCGWGSGPAYDRPYGGRGLHITRKARNDGYVITIDHSGPGSALQILPRRGRLVVVSRYTAGTGGPRMGYTRQWGSMSRTISLPRDADLSGIEREEQEGRIILTIPRFRP